MREGLSWAVQGQSPSEGCARRVPGDGRVGGGEDGAGAARNNQASLSPCSLRGSSCDLSMGVSLGFLPAWWQSSESHSGSQLQE